MSLDLRDKRCIDDMLILNSLFLSEAAFADDFILTEAKFLHCIRRITQCFEEICFADLVALAFDHEYGIFRSGNDEFVIGSFKLGKSWVDDYLAIHSCNSNFCDSFLERNIRNQKCERG